MGSEVEIYSCLCVSTIACLSHVLCIERGVCLCEFSMWVLSSRMCTLLCELFVLISSDKVLCCVCVICECVCSLYSDCSSSLCMCSFSLVE
jgi:hypothetical protein